MIVSVVAFVVALCALAVPVVWWFRLPSDRPNKNWVPTAAQVTEHRQARAVVQYEPPGREGTAAMPALPPVRGDEPAPQSRVLVLLDPLNPVQPYLMDVWAKREKLRRLVTYIACGLAAALVVVGVVLLLVR